MASCAISEEEALTLLRCVLCNSSGQDCFQVSNAILV